MAVPVLVYNPEDAVDLDFGAIVATKIHCADQGDTTTLHKTLDAALQQLEVICKKQTKTNCYETVRDKGYHSRKVLKKLDGGVWKPRIAERKCKGLNWWDGDHEARRAVYNNRARISSGIGKEAARKRTEFVERSFEHCLDRCGGMRRAWLRGDENVEKRYLIHDCFRFFGPRAAKILRQAIRSSHGDIQWCRARVVRQHPGGNACCIPLCNCCRQCKSP